MSDGDPSVASEFDPDVAIKAVSYQLSSQEWAMDYLMIRLKYFLRIALEKKDESEGMYWEAVSAASVR